MTLPTELGPNEWMMIWGAGLVALGFFVMWRTSRYDLAGAAMDSAWQVATGGRTAESKTAIEEKLHDIASAPTVTGKATRAAGTVIGHFFAKVMGLIATIMMGVGAVLIAAGIWWR